MFVSKLLIGETLGLFVASFLGILLLGKTRKISWVLIISAVIIIFACKVIQILSLGGIVPYDLSGQGPLPLWYLIIKLGGIGLFIIGLIAEIIRKRNYY